MEVGRETFLRAIEIAPAALVNFELFEGVATADLIRGDLEGSGKWGLRAIAANGEWLGSWWTLAAAYGHLGKEIEAKQATREGHSVATAHR